MQEVLSVFESQSIINLFTISAVKTCIKLEIWYEMLQTW